ncbi:MAG: NTP transferase domain-containing protein [Deltaproteobacteria bacterium]|nr:NTP transferase domain-containing protein [Deltaproteobacteria bacterium]MBW2648568.1 NTP transferase domain-containing protein [Deltaproteobacteria bacterium]
MTNRKREGLATVILAAGKGTRMKSDLAKVLHPVCGKPMLWYVVALARTLGSEKTVVVTGHQADLIKEAMKDWNLIYAHQEKQLGTAHAVLQANGALRGFDGDVLILCGDVPLLLPSTIEGLLENHRSGGASITVMTAILDDPGSYGRVVKNREGDVLKIVEARDADTEERAIKEINTGIYCAENAFLFEAVKKIDNKNAQGEYYLTDILDVARRENRRTGSFIIGDPSEAMGINTPDDLKTAEGIMKSRA